MSSGEVQQIYEVLQRIDELLAGIEAKTQGLEGTLPQATEAAKSGFYTIPDSEMGQAGASGSGVSVPAEGEVPSGDDGGGGFTTFYSMRTLNRVITSMGGVLAKLEKTQGEQGKQILELVGKATAAGSDIFMLQIMGKRFASAIGDRNVLGAAIPVIGAISGGIGVGITAAEETQRSLQMVKEGQIAFGSEAARKTWESEQAQIATRHMLTLGLL